MTYDKPEIVKLDSALGAIQGGGKPVHSDPDGIPENATAGAYESDE